jgi:pimeloyl-ACP methyl ester carboxylesterase
MQIVDRGRGVPVVVIPGIQGRWEYLGPTIDALARSFRVITFSLDAPSEASQPGDALDELASRVFSALERLEIGRAVICGISFGGLVALRFAVRHPTRTAALILVSTPGPDFRLSTRHRRYARSPFIFGPLFLAETPWRLRQEIVRALPAFRDRVRFGWRQARTLFTAPLSLRAMAARGLLIGTPGLQDDGAQVTAPTLLVTGEPSLDRVVRVESTLAYARAIRGSRAIELADTGHVGYLTRPDRFRAAVQDFVSSLGLVEHDAA